MRQNVAILYVLCCFASTWATAAETDYAQAVAEAVKAGKAADVNRLCVQWAKEEPGNEKPRIVLGQTLLKAGMADRALEQFELAVEANPLSPVPHYEVGMLFLEAGKPDAADKELAEALRLDAAYLPARLGRIRVKLFQEDPAGALADAKRCVRSHPESARARAIAGECLLMLGRMDEARSELETSLGLDPANADALFALAKACQCAGREAEAQEHWKRFLQIEATGERAETVRNGWVILCTEPLPVVGNCAAVSPDGKQVAYTVSLKGVFRAPLQGTGAPTQVTPCPEGWMQRYVTWSPDGSRLAYSELKLPPGKQLLIKSVSVQADEAPESIEFPGLRSLSRAVWSPLGDAMLCHDQGLCLFGVLSVPTGECRRLKLVTTTGTRVYAGHANYLPDAVHLVSEGLSGRPPKARRAVHLARADTGEVVAKLFDCGPARFKHPAVSGDGHAVAGILFAEPSYLIVAATSPPSRSIRLCEAHYGFKPSWLPEGNGLVARVAEGKRSRLSLVRLGGFDGRPVCIAAERQGNRLSVIVTSQAEAAQQVGLRWEAFDADSLRIALGEAEDGPLDVKPKEKAEWAINVDPAIVDRAQTMKIVALNEDGRGAVKLVDW